MLAIAQVTIRFTVALCALMCACCWANATTFSDYEHRVSSAATLIEELRGAGEDESIPLPEQQFFTTNLARVRQLLPAEETVTLEGQSVTVDNSWLHQEITALEKATHESIKADALERIAERLRAIKERLDEVKRREATIATDKDADKGRLAEILRRPEYIQRAPEGSAVQRLLARFLRWLFRLLPRRKPMEPGGSGLLSTIAQIFVVGICLALIALLIWRYGPRLSRNRKKKKAKREARIVLGERLEPDQTAADLLAQADALARTGDLRAAIRKAYIALLCELGDRKLISLAQHKTNQDYLQSVQDKISLYSSMRKLTTRFELHWYGLVPAAESDWVSFRNDYQRIIKS